MIHYQTELTIDFGKVGWRYKKEDFRVRLDGSRLTNLIEDAENAYRVYELMLIERPGDIWPYVWVILDAAPLSIVNKVEQTIRDAQPEYSNEHPWPLGRIPFTVFDDLFYWAWDDTDPEDEAWLNQRNSPTMKAYADQLLAMVRSSRANISWNDVLQSHIASTIQAGKHPFCYLDRAVAIRQYQGDLNKPIYTVAFYAKLDELLEDPELVSVAYRDGRVGDTNQCLFCNSGTKAKHYSISKKP